MASAPFIFKYAKSEAQRDQEMRQGSLRALEAEVRF